MKIKICKQNFTQFLFFLLTIFFSSNDIFATTYYSNSTAPNSTGSWWTNMNGTGSNPSNFTTSGDIFILQNGQTCNTTGNWVIGTGVTLQVDGILSINGNNNTVTINGTVSFTSGTITQVTMAGAGSGNDFILSSAATLKTGNANGIQGTNCALPVNATKRTVTLSTTAHYEFNGTVAQVTLGLPVLASGGTLIISNATAIVSLSAALNIGTGVTTTINANATLSTGFVITRTGTFTVNGSFRLNSGGSVSAAPTYGSSSTLIYNQGGTPTFGSEWTGNSTTAGAGIPQNVTIQNSTILNMPTTDRGLAGSMTVSSGTLNLNATSGNLYVGGSWTRASGATFTHNNRTVFFNGINNTQTITVTGGGTETYNILVIDKATGGNLTLSSSPATNVTVTAASGNVFEIRNAGGLDLNGQTFTVSGSGGNLYANGGTRTVSGTSGGTFSVTGTKTVTGIALVFGTGTTLKTSVALNFGTANLTTVNGSFQIDNGGSVSTNSPKYGNASTLIYNQSGTPTFGLEWTGNSTTSGTGIPQNVTIQNSTTVNLPTTSRGLAGNLNITSGSLVLNATSGDIYIGGSWTRAAAATFTQNGRTVFFNGINNTQTIGVTGGGTQTFSYLTIDKATGGNLTLSSSPATNVTVNATSGNAFEIKNAGGLNLNGQTFTMSGAGGNIYANGGTRNITGSGTFNVTGSKTVTGTALVFSSQTTLTATAAINFGTGNLTTVNGIFQIDNGGSVSTNSPKYGNASTLIYNQTGSQSLGLEWTGNSSTAGTGIPKNVTIQNATALNLPTTNRGIAGDLNISNGTLTLNATSGDLYIGGGWNRTSSGTFVQNDRKLFFNGNAYGTIKAPESTSRDSNGSFGGETFSYLTIDKSSSTDFVQLLSNICITKTLTFTKGTFDLDTSDVVLISNSTLTADIDKVLTPSNVNIAYSSTGRFIVQRYIDNTSTIRTWRFLTAPFESTDPLTINNAWQEGQVNANRLTPNTTNPWPGFGTHITGPGSAYDATKGFDQGLGNTGNSIEYFDNSGATTKFSYPANTKSTALMSKPAWGIFIRGDRGFVIGAQNTPSASVTLEPKGKINIGDITSTIVSGKTNLVGNPYPSQVNMAGVNIGGAIEQDFKLWDPKAYSNYSNTGKYIFFNWNGVGYDVNNGPVTTWASPGTIESSAAFFTYNTVAGTTITFHESDKVPGNSSMNGIQSRPVAGSRPMGTPFPKFQADLQFYDNPSSKFNNLSGANIYYSPNFNSSVIPGEDNVSPVGSASGEIRVLKNGQQLSTDREPLLSSNDTVQLYLSTLNPGAHRLVLSTKYFDNNLTGNLVDQFLNVIQPIIIGDTDTTLYDFTITSPASNAANRFMILFNNTVLPVKFNNVNASLDQGKVSVKWKIENELNVKNYEVERSEDGIHFTKSFFIASNTSGIYNLIDESPINGNNYYKIRVINSNGSSLYSQIIKIKTDDSKSGIYVLNPIENNTLSLQFTNQTSGIYTIKLYNQAGQLIDRKDIKGIGNNWTESFLLRSGLSKGIYSLEIAKTGNKILTKQIMIK
ncbi:MAG: hypothetical protein V4556_10225 [Bacteroidota bacterium]